MDAKAQLNSVRLAPRKVRAVVRLVRGKNVDEAINQLEYMVKRPGMPVKKLIESAIANAENNFNMVRSNLYIKDVQVDEGVKLRRFRPKAFGRAATLQKKTSHIRLILGERVAGLKQQAKKKEKTEVMPITREAKLEKRPEIKEEIGKKESGIRKFGRKIFQRKAV